jgi:hypothetical protein
MSDETQDPSGNTQAFRAFVQRDEPAQTRSNRPLVIGVAVAAVLLVLVLVVVAIVALG